MQPISKAPERPVPLLKLVQIDSTISLPGINQKAQPKPEILIFFNRFFGNLFSTVNYLESHFPDLRRYAVINLFSKKREEEKALDEKNKALLEQEAKAYTADHKNDKDFRIKLRVHLLNYAQELLEGEAKHATKLNLVTQNTLAKPVKDMQFAIQRWLLLAIEKDPENKQAKLEKDLKGSEDAEMRRVVLQRYRPKTLADSVKAEGKSNKVMEELNARADTCVFDNLAILCYEYLENKVLELFPTLTPNQEYPIEHVDLCLRYHMERLIFLIERMKKRFFAESLGLELSSPRQADLTDINDVFEKLRSDFSNLNILVEEQPKVNKKESRVSSSFFDLFSPKPKPQKEEPSLIRLNQDSYEWKQFCEEWNELGSNLQILSSLLPKKKQLIAAKASKVLSRTVSKSRLGEAEGSQSRTNLPSPITIPQPFTASSPRPIALVSPRKTSNPAPVFRLAPASPFSNAFSPRGIGSPRATEAALSSSPRSEELESMMASNKFAQSPRSSARDLTSVLGTFELAMEVIAAFNKKIFPATVKKGEGAVDSLSKSSDSSTPTIESENFVPIVEFNSLSESLSSFCYELMLALEQTLDLSLSLLDDKRPNPIIELFLKDLERIEAKFCEEQIKPELAKHKSNFEQHYLQQHGQFKEDYYEQYASSAWQFLKDLDSKIRSAKGGSYRTIPMLDDDLKTPIPYRAVREILNTYYSAPNQNMDLKDFLHIVKQRTLREGIIIQLGSIARNPHSLDKSSEAVFWNKLFKYLETEAEKIASDGKLKKSRPYSQQEESLKEIAKASPSHIKMLLFDEFVNASAEIRSLSKQSLQKLPEPSVKSLNSNLDKLAERADQIQSEMSAKTAKLKILNDDAYLDLLQKWQDSAPKGKESDRRLHHSMASQNWKGAVERVQSIAQNIATLLEYFEEEIKTTSGTQSILKGSEGSSKPKRASGVTFRASYQPEAIQNPMDPTVSSKKLKETITKVSNLLGQAKQAIISLPLSQPVTHITGRAALVQSSHF